MLTLPHQASGSCVSLGLGLGWQSSRMRLPTYNSNPFPIPSLWHSNRTAKGKKRIPIKELHYNHAALLPHLNESRADEQGVFYQIDKIWCVEFEDGFEGYMKPPGKKKVACSPTVL